ncbi:MAG: hypothetical protein AUG17_04630 [Crenarchaeota archaeon 13_1_20CM_2_53_14]|nr:MAG: hypothetical protein AUI07_09150 [archaeon 13_2_20CM_2_53_6]OLE59024.1 MAG: hypothetical protein AUG17_04630 [Crenarchaeota archaeon 13_1_20CM_2_53_14]
MKIACLEFSLQILRSIAFAILQFEVGEFMSANFKIELEKFVIDRERYVLIRAFFRLHCAHGDL